MPSSLSKAQWAAFMAPNPNMTVRKARFLRINLFSGNLVWYGFEAGDLKISDNQRQNGMQIKLHNMFPYYGGRYNYTMVSPSPSLYEKSSN